MVEKQKKVDVDKILEKKVRSLLKISKQTKTLAEPNIDYLTSNMKSFIKTHSRDFVLVRFNFFSLENEVEIGKNILVFQFAPWFS